MLQQRVLLSIHEEESTTEGGLFVPETVARNVAKGNVEAVEEGKLRVGDEVLFDTRQAIPIKLEGQDFQIVHESQVLMNLGRKKEIRRSTR